MTPKEKAAVINFITEVENAEDYALYHKERADKPSNCRELTEKLEEEWQDDIFICPSCAKCVTWDDSVKATGDIVEGKAGSPSEIICKGCAKNE